MKIASWDRIIIDTHNVYACMLVMDGHRVYILCGIYRGLTSQFTKGQTQKLFLMLKLLIDHCNIFSLSTIHNFFNIFIFRTRHNICKNKNNHQIQWNVK